MSNKTVILIGFSTAGKSHYLRTICELNPFPIYFLDSDKFVSKEYGGHIYNIFLTLGREKALEYIKTKEQECIEHLSTVSIPTLVAAGPFLVTRDGWKNYFNKCKPHCIYLSKSLESIYEDLCKRKQEQKEKLDINHSEFGSWDNGVTTIKIDGKYQDLSKEDSLKNIAANLQNVTKDYNEFQNETFDSDVLKNDSNKSGQLLKTIVDRLR